MDWMKGAGTAVKVAVIVVCGVLALGVLSVYAFLTVQGHDTTEFRQWIVSVANLLMFPVVGAGTVAAISAANSAKKAEENTNGALTSRDAAIEVLQGENNALRDAGRDTRGPIAPRVAPPLDPRDNWPGY